MNIQKLCKKIFIQKNELFILSYLKIIIKKNKALKTNKVHK